MGKGERRQRRYRTDGLRERVQVSSYFAPRMLWRAFFCSIVAAITIQILRASSLEKLILYPLADPARIPTCRADGYRLRTHARIGPPACRYEITFHHRWRWFELPAFILIGLVGGFIGAHFIRLNVAALKLFRSTAWL
jgi:chloride channel 3/4/5